MSSFGIFLGFGCSVEVRTWKRGSSWSLVGCEYADLTSTVHLIVVHGHQVDLARPWVAPHINNWVITTTKRKHLQGIAKERKKRRRKAKNGHFTHPKPNQ